MANIILLISFMLDGLLSIYQAIPIFGIIFLKPMFTIVSLTLIYPKYLKKYQSYYKTCFLVGFIYDMLYTNTFPLNTLFFPLMGFIVQKLYIYIQKNLINGILINLIIVTIYHVTFFVILSMIGYLSFSFSLLSYDFFSILLTNTIFYIILYIFINKKKRNIKYNI
jgi:rod shape-determining protein MreD